jgi:hypothetical protein
MPKLIIFVARFKGEKNRKRMFGTPSCLGSRRRPGRVASSSPESRTPILPDISRLTVT